MPWCLIPLLGWDILHKLEASLHIPPLNQPSFFSSNKSQQPLHS
jgi:hypothetical protein